MSEISLNAQRALEIVPIWHLYIAITEGKCVFALQKKTDTGVRVDMGI